MIIMSLFLESLHIKLVNLRGLFCLIFSVTDQTDVVYFRHGWNLHNFVESKGSILHHLGLIAGMLYKSFCYMTL